MEVQWEGGHEVGNKRDIKVCMVLLRMQEEASTTVPRTLDSDLRCGLLYNEIFASGVLKEY